MSDVKETKELLVGILKLAGLLAVSFKDGAQVEDVAVIFAKIQANPELKQALLDAYNGAGMVSEELKDLSLLEDIELLKAGLPELVELIKVLKK